MNRKLTPTREKTNPKPDQLAYQARISIGRGEHQRAIQLLEQAVHRAPSSSSIQHLLGLTQMVAGSVAEGASHLEQAVAADPENPEYHLSLARCLLLVRPADAISHFYFAIHHDPKAPPDAYSLLAAVLLRNRRPDEALQVCESGLAVYPSDPGILRNRASALLIMGRYAEALPCALQQCELAPKDADSWHVLGNLLRALGRLPEAIDCGRQACTLNPKSADAHFGLSLSLLLAGEYREGFEEYDWRWESTGATPPQALGKTWDGSPPAGKRILLWAEQGAGDVIQFARYAPLLSAQGARVVLGVPEPLARLMRWMPGDYDVIVPNTSVPIDAQCPFLTLPRIFRTELTSIPPPSTFEIPADLKRSWMERLACPNTRSIGLAWSGNPAHANDRNRSIPLSLFAPLLALPGARFFSLQVGPAAGQIGETRLPAPLQDLSPLLTDYAESAAALSSLDLVITVDTSVAHLAASLSIPTWILLPFAPDWRWLLGRSDTPWYPAVRLFRQPAPNDWQSVMHAIRSELLYEA